LPGVAEAIDASPLLNFASGIRAASTVQARRTFDDDV
jgi:hypothetical protein